ncbi:MAG TPA: DUF6600 domain-containing protein [Puia sp.]|jgi:hypothetical protein|nr:DUF6600 domain-containing protein [Puia sp.]
MRKLFYALTVLCLFAQFSCGPTYVVQNPAPAPAPPPPAPEASYQNFYDALSPYGEWIDNPEYGYVWMPNAGPDFKPYATNGNWVYTDEGWAWNSDYSWGWAPFHYGRWFYEDGYGWMWIPGNEWAPAWVTWRTSPDYYGWAPLGPSVSITVAAGGGYNPPPHYWSFVPHQYVTSPHINNYYVNERQNVTIINNSRGNNYAGGPDPGEVSRVTGSELRPVGVRESNAPGANRTEGGFAIYRPRINAAQPGNGGSSFHPAPAHAQHLTNVRPVNTTVYNNNRETGNNTSAQPTNQPTSQPTNQPASQPANQPATPPATQGQPTGQPTGQPGNQPAFHPNNTRFNGNTNAGNAGTVVTPNTPKPTTNQSQSRTVNHPPAQGNGNGNGHPGQQGANGNSPKPHTQQGQKPKDNQQKPKPNNAGDRP